MCSEKVHGEAQGLEQPRRSRIPGWPQWPTTYHFHVLSREVLDFLLHPLDALQKVLVLLVHSLVLLHQGLQLDLSLTGAFQLQYDRDRRPGGFKTQ